MCSISPHDGGVEDAHRPDSEPRALRTVLQVAEAVNGSTDVADVIERAVDAIVAYTRFPACGLFRLTPDGAWLDMIAHRNLSREVHERARRLPVEGSLTGHAIRSGAVVTTRDLARDTRVEPATRAALAREGYVDVASVPLIYQGKPLGALNFIYRAEDDSLSETEREILLGIGRTVAMALANRTAEEDRRKLQEQVRKAEQLELIGLLAGGIAHDFNNLLTGLLGALSLGRQILAEGGDPLEALCLLDDALKASHRASELVRQLLTFSKGGAPILRPTNQLGALIRESSMFSSHGSSVRLEFDLAPGLHTVAVDSSQFSRVIQNLVINAIQASPAGGVVRIEAANLMARAPGEGPAVCIRVVDQGHGIPASLVERIFEPDVTTRPGGSGLGLATVRSIVQRHGGTVQVESTGASGTVFRVVLPSSPATVTDEPVLAESSLEQGPASRVLVMDDESLIRDLAHAVMERVGHRVVCTASGEQAIAACEQAVAEGAPFDVAILDLTVVGGMGGRDALNRIKNLIPSIASIVSSGYSQEPIMASHEQHGFDLVLQKPYTPAELLRAVGRARMIRQSPESS